MLTPKGASTTKPAVVPHLGDLVSLTMYMRLKRQIQYGFISVTGDHQREVEEEMNADDADAKILQPKDLELPPKGQHAHQVVRLLPPESSPRFGINKAVTVGANSTLRAAGQSLQEDKTLQQSDLALRFSVGSGLAKESTWLPLAARRKYMNALQIFLSGRMTEMQAGPAADAEAERQRNKEVAEDMDDKAAAAAEEEVQYLSRIIFFFGYRTGEVQKMTSFSMAVQYSPAVKPDIELQFLWSEDRPYNPNRAITLCSAVVVLVSMMTAMAVFHPSSKVMVLFTQRIVAMRSPE
ncbi:hypothetical protein JKF63_05005 [Porcisia hertigi]|uniref:Uncharacterized protein n=1 Tax=Porcisia hertigi TaxID=2761500 RepID=A0A836LEU7_9TRYP|nr:hypothetical protein JKF63_05005 [Porcisia hertigi]